MPSVMVSPSLGKVNVCRTSLPLELRGALFQERLATFVCVGRIEHQAYHGLFMRQRSSKRHLLRSEEHTSELQSLMRISYAVFCLKKKKQTQQKKKPKTNTTLLPNTHV